MFYDIKAKNSVQLSKVFRAEEKVHWKALVNNRNLPMQGFVSGNLSVKMYSVVHLMKLQCCMHVH